MRPTFEKIVERLKAIKEAIPLNDNSEHGIAGAPAGRTSTEGGRWRRRTTERDSRRGRAADACEGGRQQSRCHVCARCDRDQSSSVMAPHQRERCIRCMDTASRSLFVPGVMVVVSATAIGLLLLLLLLLSTPIATSAILVSISAEHGVLAPTLPLHCPPPVSLSAPISMQSPHLPSIDDSIAMVPTPPAYTHHLSTQIRPPLTPLPLCPTWTTRRCLPHSRMR